MTLTTLLSAGILLLYMEIFGGLCRYPSHFVNRYKDDKYLEARFDTALLNSTLPDQICIARVRLGIMRIGQCQAKQFGLWLVLRLLSLEIT